MERMWPMRRLLNYNALVTVLRARKVYTFCTRV